jgi:hypothetical protein
VPLPSGPIFFHYFPFVSEGHMNTMTLTKSVRITVTFFIILGSILGPTAHNAKAQEGQSIMVLYVTASGEGDCSGWGNSCSLQSALSAASSGQEVWVAAGTYTPGTDRSATFQLKDGVAIYGGFAGDETDRSARDPAAHQTVLSGEIGASGDTIDNSYHVVTGSGTDSTAILDGFTITLGYAIDNFPENKGAGMYNSYGSPTLNNLVFNGNWGSSGAGIYNYYSSPALTHVTFSSNTALWDGGGMNNYVSNTTLTDVTFINNTANGGASCEGGGMYNFDSDPVLTDVDFIGNSALYDGGGMYNDVSDPSLTNVTFSGNSAGNGGGMYNGSGFFESNVSNPTLVNVTFSNNTAQWNGGGMYNNTNSNPTLTNVTFSGNSSTNSSGGGMYNYYNSPVLTNVTFSGNTIIGMVISHGSPTLTNVTFSGNGIGIYNDMSNPVIKNSIFWGNTDKQLYFWGGSPTVTYSDVQGGYPGVGNIDADPHLSSLSNYGGFTPVLPILPGSAAIDAGDDASCPTTDQRGVSRPIDGDGDGVAVCDMGAFEASTTHLISGNVGIANATLHYIDGTSKSVTADPKGNYWIYVSPHWTGTVTPSLPGYVFSPTHRTYSEVTADQSSQNYMASSTSYLPDLVFTSILYPSVVYTNDDIIISMELTNQNDAPTGPFYVDLDIDGSTACFDYGDYYWDMSDGLAGRSTIELYVVIPASELWGSSHTFSVYADTECEVAETSESNNGAGGSFTISSPPPGGWLPHDDIGSARTITAIPYTDTVDVRGTGRAADDPFPTACSAGPGTASVWYVYTPPANIYVSLDTFGSDYDTVLSVWTGTRGSLAMVTCSDDFNHAAGNVQSAVQVNMMAGTTYYIEVAQYSPWVPAKLSTSETELGGRSREDSAPAVTGKALPEVEAQAGGILKLNATSSLFADVPTWYWANSYIERLYAAGITGGCGGGNYCPETAVSRGQMAVFLERGMNSSSYTPPAATGTVFGDVPTSYWSASWVEKLFADGITGGCGGGNYCPDLAVSRAQMAVFLLRAKLGSSYTPPPATGVFPDVPTSYWAAPWIEQLYAEGITGGCGGGNYCPDQSVTRGQMAVFLVRTFSLP